MIIMKKTLFSLDETEMNALLEELKPDCYLELVSDTEKSKVYLIDTMALVLERMSAISAMATFDRYSISLCGKEESFQAVEEKIREVHFF